MKHEGANSDALLACESCLRFQLVLADYLDGGNHPEILTHAEECDFCRCLLADLEAIQKTAPDSCVEEPPAAVWANVRSTLAAEGLIRLPKTRFGGRWLAGNGIWGYRIPVAGAAAVIVAAVVLFRFPGYLHRLPAPHAAYTMHAAAFMQGNADPEGMASLRQTINELEKEYHANESSLEPSMKATYTRSLASLDGEIRDCQVSMKQEPGNGLAQNYLSNAYAQKAQLLQTALEYNLR